MALRSVKEAAAACEQNVRFRRTMEDEHVILDRFNGVENCGYFAVYDGHGGRDAVNVVKDKLHENLGVIMKADSGSPLEALKKAYLMTDDILKSKNVMYQGTTAASALIMQVGSQRKLFVANSGDSRVVLCRGGKAHRLTYDDRASDIAEADRVCRSGGFVINNRVNGILSVTRALGDHAMKDYVTGEPHLTSTDLTSADNIMILACDGVWDVIEDQEACDIVSKLGDAQSMAQALLKQSLAKFTSDNITVVVVIL